MENFSPGWNSSRLTGLKFRSDYMTKLGPGSKLAANSSTSQTKMAAKQVLVFQALCQVGLLFAMNFQLFGIIMLYNMAVRQWNLAFAAYISSRRKSRIRNLRLVRACQVRRKKTSVWVVDGKTDEWWQKIIGKNVPEWTWRKNFLMSQNSFNELFDKLRLFVAPDPNTPNHRLLNTEKS